MATTTNYSWTTPDDTDLVKDGAAAIRTLGSSIDTTTKNLNPQTTTGAIAYRSATSNVNTALPIGTAGQVLTVNSGATAPEWAAAGGAANFTLLNAGGTALTGAQDITVSGISGKETIMLYVVAASSANASSSINVRINGLTTAVYNAQGIAISNPTSYNKTFLDGWDGSTDTKINLAIMSDTAASTVRGYVLFQGCNSSGVKIFNSAAGVVSGSGKDAYALSLGGYVTAGAITSVTLRSDSGNFDAGTLFVYAA
jgi:hypothetical protein